jgi:DnaJ-class molecular chaperone
MIERQPVIAYFGSKRTTEVAVELLNLQEASLVGIGKVSCVECEGTGDWSRFLPEHTEEACPCVTCKGQGFIYLGL